MLQVKDITLNLDLGLKKWTLPEPVLGQAYIGLSPFVNINISKFVHFSHKKKTNENMSRDVTHSCSSIENWSVVNHYYSIDPYILSSFEAVLTSVLPPAEASLRCPIINWVMIHLLFIGYDATRCNTLFDWLKIEIRGQVYSATALSQFFETRSCPVDLVVVVWEWATN